MAVNLEKGNKVNLEKVAEECGIASLNKIKVGLGWDPQRYDGSKFDLDSSVFMCGASGKVEKEKNFIFYNNMVGNGIEHKGDNTTGGGEGDDETILIELDKIDADIQKLVFAVTIHKAEERDQNFGQVENSYIRIMDEETGTELLNYELGEDYCSETALVVGEIYRHKGAWKFNAVGSGFEGGLRALCDSFGV